MALDARVLNLASDHRHDDRIIARLLQGWMPLLELVGEPPVLISEEEWSSPTSTRVVPIEEARRILGEW